MTSGAPVTVRPAGDSSQTTASATSSTADHPLDRVRGEDDLLLNAVLAHPVGLGLVGDLVLHQGRAHVAGADGGRGDAVRRALQRQHLHESQQPVLGRHVGRLERRGDQPVHGRHGDEPPLRLDQRRPRVLGQQERAGEQQRGELVPAVLGELGDRRDVLQPRDRHQHVQTAVRLQSGVDRLPVALARREVGLHGHRPVGAHVDTHDVHALGRQALGHRAADPAGRSCDNAHFPR